VLTRVAASHLRVGTFQYFAARGELDAAAPLPTTPSPATTPLAAAPDRPPSACCTRGARQAALVAQWMNVGFIHGVMNTDNMTISGETIDYGPCAFMEAYDPGRGVQLDRPRRPLRLRQPAASSRAGTWRAWPRRLLPLMPFDEATDLALYAQPAPREMTARYQTFCGT
jgi:uncharacterized protein YdiU (UPF0061 family)